MLKVPLVLDNLGSQNGPIPTYIVDEVKCVCIYDGTRMMALFSFIAFFTFSHGGNGNQQCGMWPLVESGKKKIIRQKMERKNL